MAANPARPLRGSESSNPIDGAETSGGFAVPRSRIGLIAALPQDRRRDPPARATPQRAVADPNPGSDVGGGSCRYFRGTLRNMWSNARSAWKERRLLRELRKDMAAFDDLGPPARPQGHNGKDFLGAVVTLAIIGAILLELTN